MKPCDGIRSSQRDGSPRWFHWPGFYPPTNQGAVLSGEVHGAKGVLVDLNSLGQGLVVPPIALAGCMTALSTTKKTKIYKK